MKKLVITAVSTFALMGLFSTAYAADGAKTYKMACFACHSTGIAGSPKVGDKAAWKARIAKGMKVLNTSAIKGSKTGNFVMPPKGGRADLSDDAVKAAVAYMVKASK